MKNLLLLTLLCACPAVGLGQSASVSSARITWFGTYQVASEQVVKDKSAPFGQRSIIKGVIPPRTNDDKVRAVPNTRFGFGYTLVGSPAGAVATIRHVRKFPPEGIFNPQTRQRHYTHEVRLDLEVDRKDLFVGYALGRDFELVPGPWTFEVWNGERLLLTKTFLVYKP